MLSFGYTMLFNNIFSMVRLHRLNPYVGFFHADKPAHPALVSDLIEEFRCIIEAMVVGIINKHILKPGDFYYASAGTAEEEGEGEETPAPKGCFLTDEARKKFVAEFEQLMHREVTHPNTNFTVSYRRCLDLQVQNFAQHLRGEKPYIPFVRK
jgi:CRISPR-associated protein Cas1